MKINYLALFLLCSIGFSAKAQHWFLQENQFIYQDFWFEKTPANVKGFYTAMTELWSPATQLWGKTNRLDNKFGANNLPKTRTIATWSATNNNWTLTYNDTLVFNGNALKSSTTRRPVSGVLSDAFRTVYTLNANNEVTHKTLQGLNTGVWINSDRDSVIFQNNRRYMVVKQLWSTLFNIWGDDARDSLIYNANGLVSEYYYQANIGGIWRTAQRDMITYNATGKRTELRREFTDALAVKYDTIFRWQYRYNTRGHLDTLIREQYNKNARLWQSHSRVVFTLNTEGVVLVENFESADGSGGWRPNTKTTYNLTGTPTTENTEGGVFTIFPNPSHGFLTIKTVFTKETAAHIRVFDLLGRLVFEKNLGQISKIDHSFDLNHLPNGAYRVAVNGSQQAWVKL